MKKLYILGFGCGDKSDITLKTIDILKYSDKVYARTKIHPSACILDEYNIEYSSFDYLYESEESFDNIYQKICDTVLSSSEDIISYIVPGSALIAEKSVLLMLQAAECEVKIIPAVSFIDGVFASMKIDAIQSFKMLDALSLDTQKPDTTCLNLICQVYDTDIASDVKLELSKYYDDETTVYLVTAAATEDEDIKELKLYEIDRYENINHLTSLVIPPQNYMDTLSEFSSLEKIIEELRGENGCPWDMAQTHESLIPYAIEEAYEVVSAIKQQNYDNLCEELGDLLLQVMLHAQIAKENCMFDVGDVIKSISEKMIRRHPHVFANTQKETDLYKQWDEIKQKEHNYKSISENMLDVAKYLPALTYSDKIQSKAAKVNFDFKDNSEALTKVYEEADELSEAIKLNNIKKIEEEAGDLLFAAVNVIRLSHLDGEDCLRKSTEKFIHRFEKMEKAITAENKSVDELDINSLNNYWNSAKKEIN